MDITTFIAKFHSLEGETVSEKQKNFNALLRNVPSDHDKLLSALIPKNRFENLLKLKLLLKLQRLPDLLEVLKSEEEYIPAKLLKNTWFCQHLASVLDQNSAGFIEILPFLSYVTRKRLLTKLAIYGTNLDSLFDETCVNYGIHFATNLLIGCTAQKIESVIKEYNVELSNQHAKYLYQKHPQVFVQYVNKVYVEDSCSLFVAKADIHFYFNLVKDTNRVKGLGKRLTKKFVSLFKDFVITNAKRFALSLHFKTLIKSLNDDDLRQFVFNYCPPVVDTRNFFLTGDFSRLELVLGKRYYKLVSETLEKKYNRSIYDQPELISEKVLEMLDVEERQKWVTIKKKRGDDENVLIPFMKDAIPLIKKKINVTSSIAEREELIKLLVKTCKVNNDLDALAEVGRYVCGRHKNDNEQVLVNFLYTMMNWFELDLLEERHWESIETILKVLQRDKVFCAYDLYIKRIEFLHRQGKLTDEEIFKFLKFVQSEPLRWSYKMDSKDLEKIILIKSITFLPQLKEKNLNYSYVKLLNYILKRNQERPKDQISILDHPPIIESLKKAIKDAEREDCIQEIVGLSSIFQALICSKDNSELRNEVINAYFSVQFAHYNIEVDLWLLKNQPEVIHAFIDKFLDHVFYESNLSILIYVKTFTSAEFQQRVIKRALEKISAREDLEVAVAVLALLEGPTDFLGHIAPFYPTSNKIDVEDSAACELSIAIVKSFKYTSSPLVLPALVKFCRGDYLRYALESLYYLFYHFPGNRLSVFLKELSTKAVSVRKHSLFLTCIVGNVSDVQDLLKKFAKNERNVSVLKHVFTATLKYFIKNPSDEFWEYLKNCMKNLDETDSESFKLLVNVHKIPEKYQSRHVIFVWDVLKKGNNVEKNQERLLKQTPSYAFKDFPLEFILTVISENFLSSDAVNDFIVSCLTESPHKTAVTTMVFEIIQRTDFSDLDKEKEMIKTVFNFVETLVRNLERDVGNLDTLRLFQAKWRTVFAPTQAFRQHLQLSFTVFYLEANKDSGKFLERLAQFLGEVIASYGLTILDIFAEEVKNSLQSFLSIFSEEDDEFYKLCWKLLQNPGLVYKLLVVKLLPSKKPSNDCQEYRQVLTYLREAPEEAVRVLMNLYIVDA